MTRFWFIDSVRDLSHAQWRTDYYSWSAYHLYGKPGNSGENSNGTVHPSGNFITFSPFLLKWPKFSVPFVWITSARLHVQRKRKLYWYFVNGTTQPPSCFQCPKKYQYHLTEIFHWNFLPNGILSWLNSLLMDELGNWCLEGWMGMLTLHLCLTYFTDGTALGGHISPIYESEVSVVKDIKVNSPKGFAWWSFLLMKITFKN